MLQIMREKMAGFVTWFFVIILILVFALFGLGYYFNANQIAGKVVAEVNGTQITDKQLQLATDNLLRQQGLTVLSSQQQKALQHTALQALVLRSVLTQNATRIGLGVSRQSFDALLYHMPAFQENGQFSPSRYQMILQKLGLTTETLRDQLSANILANQLEASFMETSFALPSEIKHFAKLQQASRVIQYVKLSHHMFRQHTHVTAEQVKAYYQKHQQDFYTQTRAKFAYVVLSQKALARQVHVSNTEARSYYQQHKASFPKQTFDQAKSKIVRSIQVQQAQQQYANLGDKLSNLAFENPDSLAFVSKELGLKVHHSSWLTHQGDPKGIFSHTKVLKIAFGDNVLNQGNNSNIINLSDTRAVVVRASQVRMAKPKPLKQVKAIIIARLQARQEVSYAKKIAQTLAQQINQGRSVQTFFNAHHLQWKMATATRETDTLPMSLVKGVFDQGVPHKGHFGPASVLGDATLPVTYLARVTKVLPPKHTTLTKAQRDNYQLVLSQSWSAQLYQNYVTQLKTSAKIHYSNHAD